MLRSLHISGYRSFGPEGQTFDIAPAEDGFQKNLLLGANGAGKSTVRDALLLLREIFLGERKVKRLIRYQDSHPASDESIKLKAEWEFSARDGSEILTYEIAVFHLRVQMEQLTRTGRKLGQTKTTEEIVLETNGKLVEGVFGTDAGMTVEVGEFFAPNLDLVSNHSYRQIRQWFLNSVIVEPVPSHCTSTVTLSDDSPVLGLDADNFASWFYDKISQDPALYSTFKHQLNRISDDFGDLEFEKIGQNTKRMVYRYDVESQDAGKSSIRVPFDLLSHGEKNVCTCAALLALAEKKELSFLFWDEPDSHLSLGEVQHFITDLKRTMNYGTQIMVTSHHPETIQMFSEENTVLLTNEDRSQGTQITPMKDVKRSGEDLITSMILGDLVVE